jgi:hypothetical protein
MNDEELLRSVERVLAAMAEAGVEAALIGGLAVRMRRPPWDGYHDAIEDPRYLAALIRPTRDIDVGVQWTPSLEESLADAMAPLGLTPDPGGLRFTGGRLRVDIVPCEHDPARLDETAPLQRQPLLFNRTEEILLAPPMTAPVPVAGVASLVVQKAAAASHPDRHQPRDLADIAVLALGEVHAVARSAVRAELVALVRRLPARYGEWMHALHCLFADGDRRGPIAFANVARDLVPASVALRWDDVDEDVRRLASDAVRWLLADWRMPPAGLSPGTG